MGLVDDIGKLAGYVENLIPDVTQLVATASGKPIQTVTPTAPVAPSVTPPTKTGGGISNDTLKNAGIALGVLILGFFGYKALKGTKAETKPKGE